eukprot:g6384.t1
MQRIDLTQKIPVPTAAELMVGRAMVSGRYSDVSRNIRLCADQKRAKVHALLQTEMPLIWRNEELAKVAVDFIPAKLDFPPADGPGGTQTQQMEHRLLKQVEAALEYALKKKQLRYAAVSFLPREVARLSLEWKRAAATEGGKLEVVGAWSGNKKFQGRRDTEAGADFGVAAPDFTNYSRTSALLMDAQQGNGIVGLGGQWPGSSAATAAFGPGVMVGPAGKNPFYPACRAYADHSSYDRFGQQSSQPDGQMYYHASSYNSGAFGGAGGHGGAPQKQNTKTSLGFLVGNKNKSNSGGNNDPGLGAASSNRETNNRDTKNNRGNNWMKEQEDAPVEDSKPSTRARIPPGRTSMSSAGADSCGSKDGGYLSASSHGQRSSSTASRGSFELELEEKLERNLRETERTQDETIPEGLGCEVDLQDRDDAFFSPTADLSGAEDGSSQGADEVENNRKKGADEENQKKKSNLLADFNAENFG